MSALANVIREFIEHNDKGIRGQNELADTAGIRRSTLSNIVNKENVNPRPDTIRKLAAAMGVDGVVLTAYALSCKGQPRGNLRQRGLAFLFVPLFDIAYYSTY